MKIWFIAAWWPTRVHPTHGNFVEKHARLVAEAHDVTVVAVQEDPGCPSGIYEVVNRRRDGYREIVVYYGRSVGWLGLVKLGQRLMAYRVGWRAAKAHGGLPDLVHGHILIDGGVVGALLGRIYRRPLVISEHSSRYNNRLRLSFLRRYLAKWACRSAEFILPVSRQLGNTMRELHGLPGHYLPISNVVNGELFRPGKAVVDADERVSLLHVSNFEPRFKNVEGILRAYARLNQRRPNQYHLHIAGDGDLNRIRGYIYAAGVEPNTVTLSGPHTETEIATLMQAADIFILFSDSENQPVVLLEAQCTGLPCIATPVGGVGDIVIPDVTGLLVAPGDESSLVSAIEKIGSGAVSFDRETIAARGNKLYSERAVAEQLSSLYRQAIANFG